MNGIIFLELQATPATSSDKTATLGQSSRAGRIELLDGFFVELQARARDQVVELLRGWWRWRWAR